MGSTLEILPPKTDTSKEAVSVVIFADTKNTKGKRPPNERQGIKGVEPISFGIEKIG